MPRTWASADVALAVPLATAREIFDAAAHERLRVGVPRLAERLSDAQRYGRT